MLKKWISLLLAVLLLCCAAQAETVAPETVPGTQLGLELLQKLYVPGENRVISPVSLTAALAMVAEGARGATLAELLEALDAAGLEKLRGAMPEALQSANALFRRPELALEPEYLQALETYYGAGDFPLDAQVVERVNAWVCENTHGLIEQMLGEAPDPQTMLLLINAVALDAKWAKPFLPESTQQADFHAADGDVEVSMMHQTESFDYLERDGVQMVCLPYQDGALEMWVFLPAEGGELGGVLEALAAQGLRGYTEGAQTCEVVLGLPKVDVSDANYLRQSLTALGIADAFSPAAASLEGISASGGLYIDEILQKARIQMDEEGTRAAAATMVTARTTSAMLPMEQVQMLVDRPFAFALADVHSGAVCFAGVIENPAAS